MCNAINCNGFNVQCFVAARNAYAYPPWALRRIGAIATSFAWQRDLQQHAFPSSIDLDQHHHQLLLSNSDDDVITAIFSIMYWGYVTSGGLSTTRCDWLERGNAMKPALSLPNIGLPSLLAIVRCAVRHVLAGNLAAAFTSIRNLPHVGESFATKYLAFIDPESVGVFDRHIQTALNNGIYTPVLGAKCVNAICTQPKAGGRRFQAFCNMLNAVKNCLNQRGAAWHDQTGGNLGRFRSIDVERALFTIAQNPPAACP